MPGAVKAIFKGSLKKTMRQGLFAALDLPSVSRYSFAKQVTASFTNYYLKKRRAGVCHFYMKQCFF